MSEPTPDTPAEQVAEPTPTPGAEVVQFRGRNALSAKVAYAKTLADSGLLPKQYQRQPANVLYACEFGEMLGISPMAAITGIHVIEGKPTASAALLSALVRRAGHKLRVTGNDKEATAEIVRSDDPDFTFRSTWTIERAKQANLLNKTVWKQYPAAMLKARAITEVARDACEEALSGVHYTPEEFGDYDEDGAPVGPTTVEVGQPQRDWDAEIEAAGENKDKLNSLWFEAKGANRPDIQQKIKGIAAALKAKAETPPAEEKPAEPDMGERGDPFEVAEVVEGEIVEDTPQPQTANVGDLVDSLVHAGELGTIVAARDLVKSRGGKLAIEDVSGLLVRDLAGVAAELGFKPRQRIGLLVFAEKVLAYVEENGYSVANGVAVAAEQVAS